MDDGKRTARNQERFACAAAAGAGIVAALAAWIWIPVMPIVSTDIDVDQMMGVATGCTVYMLIHAFQVQADKRRNMPAQKRRFLGWRKR